VWWEADAILVVRHWRWRLFSPLFSHKSRGKSALFDFFGVPGRFSFAFSSLLSQSASLQILLDPIQVNFSLLYIGQWVIFSWHENVLPGLLPLVQHLLDQILVSDIEVLGLSSVWTGAHAWVSLPIQVVFFIRLICNVVVDVCIPIVLGVGVAASGFLHATSASRVHHFQVTWPLMNLHWLISSIFVYVLIWVFIINLVKLL